MRLVVERTPQQENYVSAAIIDLIAVEKVAQQIALIS